MELAEGQKRILAFLFFFFSKTHFLIIFLCIFLFIYFQMIKAVFQRSHSKLLGLLLDGDHFKMQQHLNANRGKTAVKKSLLDEICECFRLNHSYANFDSITRVPKFGVVTSRWVSFTYKWACKKISPFVLFFPIYFTNYYEKYRSNYEVRFYVLLFKMTSVQTIFNFFTLLMHCTKQEFSNSYGHVSLTIYIC